MSIITALPGIKRSVVYPFCFFTLFRPFLHEIYHHVFRHIEFGSIWWPCVVVLRPHGNDASVSGLLFSDFLWLFFFHPTDRPKTRNLFDAKRTKRGWPKPYGFFLGFLTTLLLRVSVYLCVSVYLSFVLFCSFFVGEITETETVQTPSIFPLEILGEKKWKARWFIDPKGNGVGLGLVTAAPVHSWAVKWSRKTKGP